MLKAGLKTVSQFWAICHNSENNYSNCIKFVSEGNLEANVEVLYFDFGMTSPENPYVTLKVSHKFRCNFGVAQNLLGGGEITVL